MSDSTNEDLQKEWRDSHAEFLNDANRRSAEREARRQALMGPQCWLPVPDNWARHNFNPYLEAMLGEQRAWLCQPHPSLPEATSFWWQRLTPLKKPFPLPLLKEPWASRFMRLYFTMLALTPVYLILALL